MSLQIRSDTVAPYAKPPAPLASRRGGAKKGCLIALVVFLVLAIGIGAFILTSWKGWAAGLMTSATQQLIQQTPLPQEEKDRIVARVTTLGADFKEGRITSDQLVAVLQAIGESPILPSGMVIAAERKYLNPSGLSNEEKEAGRLALQRLARGVVEKKVTMEEAEAAAASITTKDPNGNTQLKETVTDAELRDFLAKAKERADAAQIPEVAYIINFADELDKVVNQALGRTPTISAPEVAPVPATGGS